MKKQIFGWIYPNLVFVECLMFKHSDLFSSEDFIKRDHRISQIIEELNLVEQECEERANNDEHPEWHIYEMAQDDSYSKFLKIAYEIGFLRVASEDETIYIEGSKEKIENNFQPLINFKEHNGFNFINFKKVQ